MKCEEGKGRKGKNEEAKRNIRKRGREVKKKGGQRGRKESWKIKKV